MVKKIRIGIIGYNEGNGHPYSFSAIINGYDKDHMKKSRYPVIYNYLKERKKNEFGIDNVKITHIWTPNKSISNEISNCCFIPNVVNDYKKMINYVDAIIIARDDVNSHYEISSFFLEKKIPVFIDKPLCSTLEHLKYFKPFLKNGLLMSCSGLRYYSIINKLSKNKSNKDSVLFSNSYSFKDWFKYGIHVIESVFPIFGYKVKWVQNIGECHNNIVRIQYTNSKYSMIMLNEKAKFILSTSFISKNFHTHINYDDNFSCFKHLLNKFVLQIKNKKPSINPNETIMSILVLLASDLSKQNNGERIYIKDLLNEFEK